MKRFGKRVAALLCVMGFALSGMSFAVDGTVNASALFVRSETSTESQSLGKVYNGETVDVTGKVGDWYIINYKGETAYVFAEYVDMGDVEVQSSMGTITGSTVNVRSAPGTDNPVIDRLLDGTAVTILGIEDSWYKIKFLDLVGYVHPDYLSVDDLVFTHVIVGEDGTASVSYTNSTAAEAPASSEAPAETVSAPAPTTIGESVVEYAKRYLGYSYVYGGNSPETGFDCSGFTSYVYAQMGYSINRSSSDQYKNGEFVPYDDLQPGDLVFFSRGSLAIGHVGIYVGDGCFIHATCPGDVVRITALSSSYYAARYVGARRIA